MQNKRTRVQRNYEKRGILQTHVANNLKNYIIVTIIFLVRSNARRTIHK